jgi:2'-5' RNA ligase
MEDAAMKATFALLVDWRVHNFVRALAVELHGRYRVGLQACLLPPHVSLKQPFAVSDLASLEAYFDRFAAGLAPFEVALTRLELQVLDEGGEGRGILWLAVEENRTLRVLHDRLNRELAERFADTRAPFDGPEYRFHVTVTTGGQPLAVYRALYAEVQELEVNLVYTARQIALFHLAGHDVEGQAFTSYKVLPFGVGGEPGEGSKSPG